MRERIVIGSRGSRLALWQAGWVRERLSALDPRADVRVEIIKTSGDVLHDAVLTSIGGQGAFTRELQQALLARRIDIAVHSLKDLPTVTPAGLALGIETRDATRTVDEEIITLAARLAHAPTRDACLAERALLRCFGAGCQVPIAAHATVSGGALRLEGLVASASGETIIRESIEGDAADAERLGDELAARLISLGAETVLSAVESARQIGAAAGVSE
ncbi:MAG: hydroxymethylbilane synthase [Acidobacteriota bacterium]|nr:hydroxymethylbilane synthase [Acidobacteriota bacterium]